MAQNWNKPAVLDVPLIHVFVHILAHVTLHNLFRGWLNICRDKDCILNWSFTNLKFFSTVANVLFDASHLIIFYLARRVSTVKNQLYLVTLMVMIWWSRSCVIFGRSLVSVWRPWVPVMLLQRAGWPVMLVRGLRGSLVRLWRPRGLLVHLWGL